MQEDQNRNDIRILKFKDYTARHPGRAFGFYGLGRSYLDGRQPHLAEECFRKALSLNMNHIYSVIGLIEVYIRFNKLLKAINLYNSRMYEINGNKAFRLKLARYISSCYSDDGLTVKATGLFASFIMKYELHAVHSIYKKDPGNTLANLILCKINLQRENTDFEASAIYRACVLMEGLNDDLRWKLVQILSGEDESIYKNKEIAGLFSSIPASASESKYANTLFEAILSRGTAQKIRQFPIYVKEPEAVLSLSNLWKYLNWCRENSTYNAVAARCCKKLIRSGWVDSITIHILQKCKDLNVSGHTAHEDAILQLFGY